MSAHPGSSTSYVLEAENVHKSFGGIHALRGASLRLCAGEVHGLIGENGSGKSTLLGTISGQVSPDAGAFQVRTSTATHSLADAVAIVTQELTLAPDLSVAENILLTHAKPRRWYGVDWSELRRRAASALASLGLDIDPTRPVGSLRLDEQQLVEIARAVETGAPVLILDEPTSSLTEEGVAALAATMRRLRDRGTAVVLVSHKLDEMLALTDRMTVLRDGQTVACAPTADFTKASLIEAMLGYPAEHYTPRPAALAGDSVPALQLEDVRVPGKVHGVGFSVRRGECVGVVGLAGSGSTELFEALFGVRPNATGRMTCVGRAGIPGDPIAAMRRGLALVPADRKTDGLLLEMSICDNIAVARTSGGLRLRRRQAAREKAVGHQIADRLRVKRASLQRPVGSLSGGNQQKVLLGRWLATEPQILLLDDPTRGVDVGAKREIHTLIHDLRDEGMSILVSSTDIEELMVLCDRFIVLFRGRVVGEVQRSAASVAMLSHLAAGAAA